MLDAMAGVASETFSAVAAPIQYAAVTAFQGEDEIERYLYDSRRILRAVGRKVCERLRSCGVETPLPEGGFYLFPDFSPRAENLHSRDITTSRQLCERLLADTGAALLPGSDFGRPADELTCRLAYVDFDGGQCLNAAESIPHDRELSDDFLRAHCSNVLAGIDRIAEWLN